MERDKVENADFLLDEKTSSDPWDELFRFRFSHCHLFWIKANGNKVKLLNPGSPVDEKRFQKYRDANIKIEIDSNIDLLSLDRGVAALSKLRIAANFKSQKERKKIVARKGFLGWSIPTFWAGERATSYLEILCLYEQSFYGLEGEGHESFVNLPLELQARSLVIAGLVVKVSLICGYQDYHFLKDIYHIALFLDIALAGDRYGSLFEEVLEIERTSSGGGEKLLNEKNLAHKIDFFKSHMESSFLEADHLLEKSLNHRGLLELIKIHHEKIDGTGFPLALKGGELNDLERIIICCLSSLPQRIDLLANIQEDELILKIINNSEGQNHRRLSDIIEHVYREISDENDDEYLDVIGL